MASKAMIESMIDLFLNVWSKRNANKPVLVDAYRRAFAGYTDDEVKKAGYRALDELEYFPKPSDLKKFLDETNLRQRFTCPKCKSHASLLIEGECKYCRAKVPLSIPRPEVRPDVQDSEPTPRIEPNIRCQVCGKITLCIWEDNRWRCRQCYTGLADPQLRTRLRDLIAVINKDVTAQQVRRKWGIDELGNPVTEDVNEIPF